MSRIVSLLFVFFFVKQKTAYEMRISDWSSDVCFSDLLVQPGEASEQPLMALTVASVHSILLPSLTPRSFRHRHGRRGRSGDRRDRKSVVSGKSVSVRVDLGGRRIIKKKKDLYDTNYINHDQRNSIDKHVSNNET